MTALGSEEKYGKVSRRCLGLEPHPCLGYGARLDLIIPGALYVDVAALPQV